MVSPPAVLGARVVVGKCGGFVRVRNVCYFFAREVVMARVERISVALPAAMAGVVHDAVESGDYASASEVVRDALRDTTSSGTILSARGISSRNCASIASVSRKIRVYTYGERISAATREWRYTAGI
jgi:Arc/MetJ-type ribon-helix-helix transcriptional regulator